MPKFQKIHNNLPALFRPDLEDGSLINIFLQSVGALLDDLSRDMSTVMQAHWAGFADDARFDAYLALDRQQRALAPLNPSLEEDRLIWETFPYVRNLARLGALLALPPYRDPANLRESVEAYRTRLDRYVRLYRNGLGTVHAIRAVVEMELPADVKAPAPRRERSFSIEEFAPLVTLRKGFESRRTAADGVADDVGPLMRWRFTSDGMQAAPMTAYIQGITPEADKKDSTQNPMVECYQTDDGTLPLAIAYIGLITPGDTLRLRPAFESWLGTGNGLLHAGSRPEKTLPADPTAPGPWTSAPGAPESGVTALFQSYDRVLWLAVENGDAGELWRYDGSTWQRVLEGMALAVIHCFDEQGRRLWIGTGNGLLRVDLYPLEGEAFAAVEHADFAGMTVYSMLEDRDGSWWIGTDSGAYTLDALDDGTTPVEALAGTPVYTVCQDRSGVFYFGGELGLFQYQPGSDRWAWYRGEEESDQIGEWEALEPGELPQPEAVFLPPVRAVHVSLDASVWIGTDAGFARYYAKGVSGSTYKTMLAAYPDLVAGRVYDVREDARGLLWFITQRGLFRYDGRDLAQYQAATGWVPMGRADAMYEESGVQERDAWRYNRSGAPAWQKFDRYLMQWRSYSTDPRSTEETDTRALIWTDSIFPELGALEGEAESFTPHEDGHPVIDRFVMRVKPAEDRIVVGGLPAVPRMPAGGSTWRYLSMETEGMTISAHRPWWSSEGRLFQEELREAPYPGRHDIEFPTASTHWFGEVVFAYKPAAKLWFEWAPRRLRTVLVRLYKRSADESIPPAILDRVWQGIQRVRPAGVRMMLAVEREIVRGGEI